MPRWVPASCRRIVRRLTAALNARQAWIHVSLVGFWSQPLIGVRTSLRWLDGMEPTKSSDWMILSRRAVIRLRDASSDTAMVRRFARTLCPTESFYGTILANDANIRLCADGYRFVRWSGGPHPDLLVWADLEILIQSGDLFARKFDSTVDSRILDQIDSRIDAIDRDFST